MTHQYITADQAVRLFSERASDCERRGLPRCAESYRWLAARAESMAVTLTTKLTPQQQGGPR